jgi:hypothetical protein
VGIGGGDEQRAAIDGKIALDAGPRAFGKLPGIVPEQIAGGGVDGLHAVAEAVDKDDSVVD